MFKRIRAAVVAALLVLTYGGASQGRVTANVLVESHDAHTGALVARQERRNLVVDAGLSLLAQRLVGVGDPIGWFAYGTGTTAAAAGQTALVAEVARDVFTETITSVAKQVTVKYYLASGAGNGNTLAEIGLFNAPSGGTCAARALLSPVIVKTSSIAVTFTWTISLSAA